MEKQEAMHEDKSSTMEYREIDELGQDIDPWVAQQMASAIKEISEATKRDTMRNNAQQNRRVTELADQVHTLRVNVEDVRESVAAVNSKVDTMIGKMEEIIKGLGTPKKKSKKRGDFTLCLEEQGIPKLSSISGSSESSEESSRPRSESSWSATGRERRYARRHDIRIAEDENRSRRHSSGDDDDARNKGNRDDKREARKYERGSYVPHKSNRHAQDRGASQPVQIHYMQPQPDSFTLKLESLTVNSAVIFLEKYNELKRDHPHIPHISRFISKGVEMELLANARKRKNDPTYMLYDFHNASERKILSMIHHTVTDTYLTDPAQFLKHMEQVQFPKLPDEFEISQSNLRFFLTQVSKYQSRFVARWHFMEEKSDPRFHLRLEGRNKSPGLIECFLQNIPFEVGERIHRRISAERIRSCKGSFERYLNEFTTEMEEIITDTHRSSKLMDLFARERGINKGRHRRDDREKVQQQVKMVTEAKDTSDLETDYEAFERSCDTSMPPVHVEELKVVAQPAAEQRREFVIKSKANTGEVHHSPAGTEVVQATKDKHKPASKSPGGCLSLLNTGVCKKEGCKFFHEPDSLMRATWDFYMMKLLASKYRRSKDKLLELYPETKVSKIMEAPKDREWLKEQSEDSDADDDLFYEDSNMAHMVLMASFPDADYVRCIHREGILRYGSDGELPVQNALFDSGALHGSYVSKELVDRNRSKLSRWIQKVHGAVKLGDNVTTVNVDEVLIAVVDFQLDSGERIAKRIKLVVWPMPGLDMIIGLPHIVRHFMKLFVEMLNNVKDRIVPDGLKVLMNPWSTDLEVAAPEDEDTPLPCSFTGPLHYLSVSRDQALLEYTDMFEKHIDPEFARRTNIKEFLLTEEAISVFVPVKWEGIKGMPPLELDFKETLPDNMRPRARPVNPRLYEHAKTEFERLMTYFYVGSDSPIASPLVIAPKATKPFIRFCGDYIEINKHVKIGHYPIPKVQHALEKAAGFKVFLDIDMTNSFHQIRLGDKTSNILSVQTPWGLVRPLFLPEGVGPASGILQRTVMEVFGDYQDFMITIFDNLLVLCHDYEDAMMKFKLVIRRAYERGLVFKFAKTWLGFNSVTFFGYIVSYGKMCLSQERKDQISSIPMPNNQKQMQRFLGAVLFFKSFLPMYSDLTTPLYDMIKDGFDWDTSKWNKDYRAIFERVKEAIQHATYIHFPDYNLPWLLRVDASDVAVGAVLMQEINSGAKDAAYQPIGFSSQKFSNQATRWDPFKKEAYAVYFGVKSFSYYLHGKPLVLETDHRNLVWIEKSTVPIVIRWRVYLQSFQIWLRNIPGKQNIVADWMSRMYHVAESLPKHFDDAILPVTSNLKAPAIHEESNGDVVEELPSPQEATETIVLDDVLNEQHDAAPDAVEVTPEVHEVHSPEYYLEKVHGGRSMHKGARRTWLALNKHFPGHKIPFSFVAEWVMACPRCQKDRLAMTNGIEPVVRHLKPPHQRSRIGVDRLTVTPPDDRGNCNLIVIVEHFTKYVSAYPATDYTALTLAKCLFSHFCTFGLFDELWSDPGSDLMSEVISHLNEWFGIRHVVSLVDRHESNGVEGSNKQILRHLRTLCHDKRLEKRWSDPTILALILFTINDEVNSETGIRPLDAKFGSEDGTYFKLPDTGTLPEITSAWLRNLNTDLSVIRQISKSYQAELVQERTSSNPPTEGQNQFQPGDLILYRYPIGKPKPTKLSSPYLGPYKVIQQIKNDVQARHMTMGTIRTFHVTEIQLFIGNEDEARQLSQTDADQHQIHQIHAYIGDPATRSTCEFEVEFADGSVLWLPWSKDLFNTVYYEDFCRSNPELFPLLFTVDEAKNQIRSVRKQAITLVQPGVTVYIPLRHICPYWYDTLELDDPYHVTYVFRLHYTEWANSSHKLIRATIPVFDHTIQSLDNYFITFYGQRTELPVGATLVDDAFVAANPSVKPPKDLLSKLHRKP